MDARVSARELPAARFVVDDDRFASACGSLAGNAVVGLDTEFERTRTYYAKFALLQAAGGEDIVLADALAVSDWTPLAELLTNTAVTKVMHGCEEDLEVLGRATGQYPLALFDTQVAAGFAGLDFGMGYMRLVSQLLGIDLPKESQRSDWMQRPLSPLQLEYAAADAAWLPDLHGILVEKLAARGMLEWCTQECGEIVARRRLQDADGYDFRRIQYVSRLDRRGLAVARALCGWREARARERDRPRGWIMDDALLVDLAERRPADAAALEGIGGMPPKLVSHCGAELVEMIANASSLPEPECPTAHTPPPVAEGKAWMKRLKAIVRDAAERHQLPPALLAGQRILKGLMVQAWPEGQAELPPVLAGWRRTVIGDALLDALRELASDRGSAR